MSSITPLNFDFESHAVRFVSHEPLSIVATDICSIFGLDTSLAVNGRTRKAEDGTVYRDGGLDDDEKGTAIVSTPGGEQEVLTVNEPGLYRLIFKCRKKVAKRFQRWVFHDVLPSIRKTGKYELAQAPSQPSSALQLPTPTPQEISSVIDLIFQSTAVDPNLVAGAKANAIIKQHPQYAAAIEAAKGALTVPVESSLLNATEVGSKIGKTAREINKLLLDYGFQVKNPEGKNPSYLPTEKGKPHSKMVLETAQGRDKTVQHLRWFESVADALLEEIENTGANDEVEQ